MLDRVSVWSDRVWARATHRPPARHRRRAGHRRPAVPKGRRLKTEIRPFAEDELDSLYAGCTARDQRLADVVLIAASGPDSVGLSCERSGCATSCRPRCRAGLDRLDAPEGAGGCA
jgi:hypothetical protein